MNLVYNNGERNKINIDHVKDVYHVQGRSMRETGYQDQWMR